MTFGLIILIPFCIWLFSCIRILKEYERAVVFTLGRILTGPRGPGFIFVFRPFEDMKVISLRLITLDVPPQDIITRDNVSVKVNAVIYYKVMDPIKAVTEVENYDYATSQIAQTTLRSVIGQVELDELLSDREKINTRLQEIIDKQTDPWGVKVSTVEIKHVDLPQEMQRAMARQAEAERERRAKIIAAEGEYQAAEKLKAASEMLADQPVAIQMRYLQTLVDISAENTTTVVFPLPLEVLSAFMKARNQ